MILYKNIRGTATRLQFTNHDALFINYLPIDILRDFQFIALNGELAEDSSSTNRNIHNLQLIIPICIVNSLFIRTITATHLLAFYHQPSSTGNQLQISSAAGPYSR